MIVTVAMLCAAALLTACGGPKTSMTADQFCSSMEQKGFELVDNIDVGQGQADDIWVAVSPEGTYQIEYYDLLSEDQAKIAFSQNVAQFESMKGSSSVSSEINISNYSIKKIESDGRYMYVCRVADTLVYTVSEAAYKTEIEDIIQTIGY